MVILCIFYCLFSIGLSNNYVTENDISDELIQDETAIIEETEIAEEVEVVEKWNMDLTEVIEEPEIIEETEIAEELEVVETWNMDLEDLKWGMSKEEVNGIVNLAMTSEENYDTGYEMQHLQIYENVALWGYNTELTLCFVEGKGLNGLNYRMSDVEYNDFYDRLCAEYGEPSEDAGDYSMWYPSDEDYYIFLFEYPDSDNGDMVTQCSFFPVE